MSATCSIPVSTVARPTASLSRGGAIALSIRILGAGGMLLSHVVLARSLGVSGFGEYAQAITWLQFLCVMGKLGLDNTSLRFVSEYVTKGEDSKLHGFIRDSTRISALASVGLMLGTIATVLACWNSIGAGLSRCLLLAALMIPIVSIRQIQEASLRGVGRILESQISSAIWPLILFTSSIFVWAVSASGVSSPTATLLHLVSVSLVGVMVQRFVRNSPMRRNPGLVFHDNAFRSQWANTAFAFLAAELLIVLKSRICVAMAGSFLGSDSAGIYAAMERFADVAVLGSQSLGLVIAPQFAALFAAGRYAEMRSLLWRGQLLCLASTIPVAIVAACFGGTLLSLLGDGYQQGWAVLVTLLSSACIASFAGPSAYVLQMTGHERTMLFIMSVTAAVNVVLSLSLILPFGILGLGISQMVASAAWAVGMRISLRQHPAWQQGPISSICAERGNETDVAP